MNNPLTSIPAKFNISQTMPRGTKEVGVSLNSHARTVALAQGIKIGSDEWNAYGLPVDPLLEDLYSDHGWNMDHYISDQRAVMSILSNALIRPLFYNNESDRDPKTLRPKNYRPIDPEDQVDGSVKISQLLLGNTIQLINPRLKNISVEHLYSLTKFPKQYYVDTGYLGPLGTKQMVDAADLAKRTIGMYCSAVCGAIQGDYSYDLLELGRMLRIVSLAAKLGELGPTDKEKVADFISKIVFPKLKNPINKGQIYLELWKYAIIEPVIHDLFDELEGHINGQDFYDSTKEVNSIIQTNFQKLLFPSDTTPSGEMYFEVSEVVYYKLAHFLKDYGTGIQFDLEAVLAEIKRPSSRKNRIEWFVNLDNEVESEHDAQETAMCKTSIRSDGEGFRGLFESTSVVSQSPS